MIWGVHLKPLVDTPCWVGKEVRKGFVEGLDRVVDVILESEEGVN